MACDQCMVEWDKEYKQRVYFPDTRTRNDVQAAYSDAYGYVMNKRSHWGEELLEGLQALAGIDDLKTFGDAQNGQLVRALLRTPLVNFRTQPGIATQGAVCLYAYRMRIALSTLNHELYGAAAPAPGLLRRAQKSVCDFVNGGATDSKGHIQRALKVMDDRKVLLDHATRMSSQEMCYHAASLIWGTSIRVDLPCPHPPKRGMHSPSLRAALK